MVSKINVKTIKLETNIKTLKRDNRMCHDSSSVFSFNIETRYLNRSFSIKGLSLFVFFFIATSFFKPNAYKSSEIQFINKMIYPFDERKNQFSVSDSFY